MLGDKVKEIRCEMGLTQLKFAKLVGTTRANISDIERGKNKAGNLKILSKISLVTGKPIAYFVEGDPAFQLNQYDVLDETLNMLIENGHVDSNNHIEKKYMPLIMGILEKEIALKVERKKKKD